MTASNILDELCSFLELSPEHPSRRKNVAEPGTASTSRQPEEMRPDRTEVWAPLGTIQEMSQTLHQANAARSPRDGEADILRSYLNVEKDTNLRAGAKNFLTYLNNKGSSLAQMTIRDLETWALTPISSSAAKRNLPHRRAFEGAKALCVLAAQAGHIDPQHGIALSEYKRPQFDKASLRILLQQPELTRKEREYQIHLNYQSSEKDARHRAGASGFLDFLEKKQSSLAEAYPSDLEQWALQTIKTGPGKGNLPNIRAFEGAKALCALAAEVGYLDPQTAKHLLEFNRPQFDVGALRTVLQNPALTPKKREYQIRLTYQSMDPSVTRQAGASGLLVYLHNQNRSLAEVTADDLQQWVLTTIATTTGKRQLPNPQAFHGAKALCALAAQVGHIDAQRAKGIAECARPHFDLDSLRAELANPALSPKERDRQIRLNYQSSEKNSNRQAGASGILAYLQSQAKSLAQVTTSDLERWALTPAPAAKGMLPSVQMFEGAKAFCARAAEVGEIDPQRAKEVAEYARPQFDVKSLRMMLQNPALTPKEREYHIYLTYQSVEQNYNHLPGASGLLAYLERQGISLDEMTTSDLEKWALTPIPIDKSKGSLPNLQSFIGAKALCALAAHVGHLDPQRAKAIAECARPQYALDSLRTILQDPELTPKERESHIRLHFQSVEKDSNRQSGAHGILSYLQKTGSSLAEVTADELLQWALKPIGTGKGKDSVPSVLAFEGAKALCALAAQAGYIDAARAKDLADCSRPHYDVHSLRMLLQNPTLTPKEREYHIRLSFQSLGLNPNRQAGANGILAFLKKKGSSLATITISDLEEWTLTPLSSARGKDNLPNVLAFEGAKQLCALAAEVGHIHPQRAKEIAEYRRPHFDVNSLRTMLQNSAPTPAQRDYHIRINFQSAEKNIPRRSGANGLLAFLEHKGSSLADVSTNDLMEWALTPISSGNANLPTIQAIEGAKALCALAAQVGCLDPQQAHEIAEAVRPNFDLNALRIELQNPALSRREREYRIRLNYQSTEKDRNRLAGASAILAYLENTGSSLAEVTTSDLENWSLMPIATGPGQGNLPNTRTFEGARALCVLAAELGHADPRKAKELAEYARPQLDVSRLRIALQNPALTPKERESHIRLHFLRTVHTAQSRTGADGILAYLERQGKPLTEVSARDLEQWALTPRPAGPGKGMYPNQQVFAGAKELCALAALVGHINPQSAQEIAHCARPLPGAQTTSASSRFVEATHKRLRIDDQHTSRSIKESFALPQSDALCRELALSRPTYFRPNQPSTSSQIGSIQTLIDEIESLDTIQVSARDFFAQSLQVKATISYLKSYEPQSLQLAKDALSDRNPSAYQRLLELERELINSLSPP